MIGVSPARDVYPAWTRLDRGRATRLFQIDLENN